MGNILHHFPLIPLIPKRQKTIFKIVWGFLVGRRRAGSRYRKANFSLVRTQGQIGKGDMAPSLTPLVCPTDDIHTLPGRRNLPLALEVHSSLQPLLMLCGWWACLEMDCPPQGSLLFSRAFSSRIRAWWPLHVENKLWDWFRNRSLEVNLALDFPVPQCTSHPGFENKQSNLWNAFLPWGMGFRGKRFRPLSDTKPHLPSVQLNTTHIISLHKQEHVLTTTCLDGLLPADKTNKRKTQTHLLQLAEDGIRHLTWSYWKTAWPGSQH